MLKNIKIFPKFLFNCLLTALIPITFFAYQFHLNQIDQKEIIEQRLMQSADTLASHIDQWIEKNHLQSLFIAKLEPFIQMNADAQLPILKAATENLEWVVLNFVTDLQGNAIAQSDNKALSNYSDQPYFREVVSGKDVGQQVLMSKINANLLHCYAIPIKETNNQISGVLTQCSRLLEISDQIEKFKIGQSGYAFLVDDNNRLIAHGKQSSRLENFSNHPSLSLEKRNVTTLNYEGNNKVFIVLPVGPNWRLVVQQDYKEAYSDYFDFRNNTIFIGVTIMSLALLVSFLTSYNISTPIRKLTKIANAYSQGIVVENVVDDGRKDEIGDLARAISRISKAIQIAVGYLQKQKK